MGTLSLDGRRNCSTLHHHVLPAHPPPSCHNLCLVHNCRRSRRPLNPLLGCVDFEACFATCQCYDASDNPTHMHDAICILDECFCVFDAYPYGRLTSSPICCTKGSGNTITCDNYCDDYSDPGCP